MNKQRTKRTGWIRSFQNQLIKAGHWLIKPSARITDVAQRRNARLLSVFILVLFLLFLSINLLYAFSIKGYAFPPADLIGYVLILIIYLLSRTRHTKWAVGIMLFMFPLNVFMNVLQGTTFNIVTTLTFLYPSYVLASIFLSTLGTAIYGYGANLMLALLPVIAPNIITGFYEILGSLAGGVVVVTLCVISIANRNRIERDRQAELRQAYDSTLEGWSRTLDARDYETEEHSRRVVELTMRLARKWNIHGEELENIYRGALLHDIGKMAIPDSILLKPSSLSEEEWKIMRTHTTMAVSMLSTIKFLQPAISIPLYHHEWWNGKGYPYGLKGNQIPFAARIFAVIDVWDALLSDRPYRNAWSEKDAVAYIKQQSGRQFDPAIVKRFLPLVQ